MELGLVPGRGTKDPACCVRQPKGKSKILPLKPVTPTLQYFQCSSLDKPLWHAQHQYSSYIQRRVTPWTVACQAPLSVGFSRQGDWSGLPFPSAGDLPDPGIEPESPALQADSLPSESAHKPRNAGVDCHPLLQGIFPTLGTDLHLVRLQVDSLPASHLGSPYPSLVSCWIFASILLHKPQIFALLSGCLKSQRNRLIFVHRWLLFSHL